MTNLFVFTTFTTMDNFIPAIIIIGGIIYKIYTEFQKEQEAVRKRQATAPKRPVAPANIETVQQQAKRSVPPILKPSETIPTEVIMARKRKEQMLASKKNEPIQVIDLDEKPVFNLREAVIQSAILDRPYR